MRRAYDHDGLVAKHFVPTKDSLAKPLESCFNQAMCDFFPDTWTMSTIVPIFKSKDAMELGIIILLWLDTTWETIE